MENNKISKELIEIIMKYSSFEKEDIKIDTSLNLDYKGGMSHYDAILLFNDLYEKYNISFPKDFNVNQYFYTEGYELPNFIRKILGMSSKTKISIKNVTVGHIMKVILKQKWTEPDS